MFRDIIPFHEFAFETNGRKLNVGCGRRFHRDWVNVDLQACDEHVIACDINEGLPFPDSSFQAVYHSHVLEHLTPEQGQKLIQECFRVMEPHGVLRIVIPDLERIAKLYLQLHESAWEGDPEAMANYTWIKLELLDQMVRQHSGGMMGRYMASLDGSREHFVRSRIGVELDLCRPSRAASEATPVPTNPNPPQRKPWRQRVCRQLVKWLMGRSGAAIFDETTFRLNGEIHRWMYDRFSLRQLCTDAGLVSFRCCRADESEIEDFSKFQLDTDGRHIFKPDSLFIECRKPLAESQRAPVATESPTRSDLRTRQRAA